MNRLFAFSSGDEHRKDGRTEIRYSKKAFLGQENNIQKVKKIAEKAGFQLLDFRTNRALELFFNIYQHKETFCYISKGWEDPGFRIGEAIVLNKNHRFFKEIFYDIFRICSRNLISLAVLNERGPNSITLSLETAIYKGGFDQRAFKQTVINLKETLEKIRPLLNSKQ